MFSKNELEDFAMNNKSPMQKRFDLQIDTESANNGQYPIAETDNYDQNQQDPLNRTYISQNSINNIS